jgi:hypothetical protein
LQLFFINKEDEMDSEAKLPLKGRFTVTPTGGTAFSPNDIDVAHNPNSGRISDLIAVCLNESPRSSFRVTFGKGLQEGLNILSYPEDFPDVFMQWVYSQNGEIFNATEGKLYITVSSPDKKLVGRVEFIDKGLISLKAVFDLNWL